MVYTPKRRNKQCYFYMFKVYFYCSLYYNRSIALQQRLIYLCRLFEISENFKIVIMRDRRGEEYVNVVIYYLFFCGFWKTVDVWY